MAALPQRLKDHLRAGGDVLLVEVTGSHMADMWTPQLKKYARYMSMCAHNPKKRAKWRRRVRDVTIPYGAFLLSLLVVLSLYLPGKCTHPLAN